MHLVTEAGDLVRHRQRAAGVGFGMTETGVERVRLGRFAEDIAKVVLVNDRIAHDEHTLAITIARAPQGTRQAGRQVVSPPRTLPNTTDWYGRFRCAANAANDYQIDRKAQKTVSYTGIDAIFLQDQAVTESMGPIYDRTNERLGTSDQMIIRTRKRLIDAARALRDTGKVPPGVDDPGVYAVRSGGTVLPRAADWIEATRELRRAGVEHPGLTRRWSTEHPRAAHGARGVVKRPLPVSANPDLPVEYLCAKIGRDFIQRYRSGSPGNRSFRQACTLRELNCDMGKFGTHSASTDSPNRWIKLF